MSQVAHDLPGRIGYARATYRRCVARLGRATLEDRAIALELDPRPRMASARFWGLAAWRWALRAVRATAAENPAAALSAGIARALAEASYVRGARTAARWLVWLVRRVRWTLLRRRYREPASVATPNPARAVVRPVRPARSVGVHPGRRPEPQCGRLEPPDRPTVGAVDPRTHNPVGWTANVENRVLALGPPVLLPAGARARRCAACWLPGWATAASTGARRRASGCGALPCAITRTARTGSRPSRCCSRPGGRNASPRPCARWPGRTTRGSNWCWRCMETDSPRCPSRAARASRVAWCAWAMPALWASPSTRRRMRRQVRCLPRWTTTTSTTPIT